jgi:TolB-like protein
MGLFMGRPRPCVIISCRPMSLAPGVRLGPYEILALLGAGGMGEVWRAKDTRLGRDVAVKVLPEDLLGGRDRRARFEREARLLAALNHPGIAAVYSFEEVAGSAVSSSRHLLTMELVEGEPLSRRMKARKLPMNEALSIGRDIAAALEAAHAKEIVHRDLKPANVMVSTEGRIKLLDFGLAKAFGDDVGSAELSHSPTLTDPGTSRGVILGTAAYMSPEQARGQRVDARSDIWAFGVLLWELLTGHRLFRGQSTPDTLAAVLREPVDFKRLPLSTPEDVRDLLKRCLERDPEKRLAEVGDARRVLEKVLAGGASRGFPGVALSLAAFALILLAVGGVFVARRRVATPTVVPALAPSIAVLPFTNLTGDKDQEYFSDGLSEQVMGLLTRVRDLKVTGRTSSFAFKGKSEDLRAIGQSLNVATVLEGSVQRVADRLRVAARLVSVADGYQLWAETFDRKMTDSFALQDEIAGAVVAALKIKLAGGQNPRRHVPDPEAYAQYLLAHSLFLGANYSDFPRIAATLQKVTEMDPAFAPAYADLSQIEGARAEGNEDLSVAAGHLRRARELADKAIEVDPESPDGYRARAHVHLWGWDWDAAEADLARALALNPGGSIERVYRGHLLTSRGKLKEAIGAYRAVVQTDPLLPMGWILLAQRLVHDGDVKAAGEAATRAVSLSPGFTDGHFEIGLASLVGGDAHAALAEFEKATWRRSLGVAMAQNTLGRPKEARDALDDFIAKHGNARPYWIAVAQDWLGEREKAFDWLERARAQKDPYITWIKSDLAYFRGLRSDPRYAALLTKLNLPGPN